MKIQVRQGVFETNSSSVHSIAFRQKSYNETKKQEFIEKYKNKPFIITGGQYGWNIVTYNTTEDIINYIYTYLNYDNIRLKKLLDYLTNIGLNYKVEASDFIFIDHESSRKETFDYFLSKDDIYDDLLFGNCEICTGNDNGGFPDEPLKKFGNDVERF